MKAVAFGPRLVATPTGNLRAALLVRPGPAIERATPLAGEPGAVFSRAQEQHATLCSTLEYFGVEVTRVAPRGPDPLEASAADTAVAFEGGAVMMRLSALSRRSEVDRMEAEFAGIDVPLAGHVTAPGLLDGNDVLLAGKTAFIGAGARGNDFGRAGFAKIAEAHGYRAVEVRLADDAPPLRAVAAAVAQDTVVLGAGKVDASAFEGFRTIVLERDEAQAAGVLVLDERHVLADMRYRTALATIRRAGVTVEAIDLYEFAKLGITPSMLALALRRE